MPDEDLDVEVGSGNVYADLGFPDADDLLIKAQLTLKISEIIKARRWSQQKAAQVMGFSQPKLSEILRGHFHGVSEMKLLAGLARLGQDVKIVIGPARRRTTASRIEVVLN
jgi:predicted XRE-type DNA-binding protein